MINYIENHPIDATAGRRRLHLLYWKIGLFGASSYYHFMNDSNYGWAIIDMQEDIITLMSNVEFKNQNNMIKADRSIIKNSFQNFEYFGNVQTNIKSN